MKAFLTALEEGRFIELPEADKQKSLEYLASLLEAVPDATPGTDVVGAVLAREKTSNTGVGLGWAFPHGRTAVEGELLCAVGWSPVGIAYDAVDGMPVYVVALYYIPDNQKNAYLKELSSLVGLIRRNPQSAPLGNVTALAGARNRLLDLLALGVEQSATDARARMIRLEQRQAQAMTQAPAAISRELLDTLRMIPLSIVFVPGSAPVVLAHEASLVEALERRSGDRGPIAGTTGAAVASDSASATGTASAPGLASIAKAFNPLVAEIAERGHIDCPGYRVVLRSYTQFAPGRLMLECIAISVT